MKALRLGLLMLRFRVASMLTLFYLLTVGYHGGFDRWRWTHLSAVLCLASSYVVATSLNDIADRDIDRVNHAGRPGRPLVTGEATVRDLAGLAVGAAAATVGLGALVGPGALAVAAGSVAISALYSLPPVRLSRRALAAPIVLTIAYVGLPYGLGLSVLGSSPMPGDVPFLAALAALFTGRILLKDFRDRHGDARYGKRTILLRYGKNVTCALCLAAVLTGDLLLMTVLPQRTVPVVAAFQALFAGVVALLLRSWRTTDELREQVGIGLGAKLGNAVLVSLLGLLAMAGAHAPRSAQAFFACFVALAFLADVARRARRSPQVLLGYRG